jgi:hypothetical protein
LLMLAVCPLLRICNTRHYFAFILQTLRNAR